MKRILSFLLILTTLFPLCACSNSLAAEEDLATESKTEAKTKEEKNEAGDLLPTEEIVFPDTFSVGYNRQSIAPEEFPIITYKRVGCVATKNHDPLQLTCTALWDGEKAALLFSIDLKGIPDSMAKYSARLVEKATGVPKERIFLNATHTHYGPDPSLFGLDETIKNWQKLYYEQLVKAAELALRDLTPAEAYVGSAHTEGITFVRRYLLRDGTYKFNPGASDGAIAHESEADTEMRTIRFERDNNTDVLLVNYQTHYGKSYPDSVSADFVHPIREQAEKELNCNFAYFNGASGNLNFMSAIPGERKYPDIYAAAPAMVQTMKDAIAAEEKVTVGAIQAEHVAYSATAKGGWKKEIPFTALTTGDLGFIAAPYEMFDTNGIEIRTASPFKMTFICAYTNGSFGYVPSALAFSHGAYEVESCQFASGSGEEFAEEFVRLLNVCKEKG